MSVYPCGTCVHVCVDTCVSKWKRGSSLPTEPQLLCWKGPHSDSLRPAGVRRSHSLVGQGWMLGFITYENSLVLPFLELYVNTVSIMFCYLISFVQSDGF